MNIFLTQFISYISEIYTLLITHFVTTGTTGFIHEKNDIHLFTKTFV